MKYREFTKDNIEISSLGFGCMRFPLQEKETDQSKIDEIRSIEMIRYAIDNGVNYIDTAYPYHNGNSENIVGKALKSGYREKVNLATKLPIWLIKEKNDLDKYFNEQLNKLQTDHIDCYLLHALNKDFLETIKKFEIIDWLDKLKKEKKINYAGFSFHDGIKTFKEIIDMYNWDFCQIQLNYMDTEFQAGIEGMKYASSKNISIIVMEPLKGGKLAKPPKDILDNINENFNAVNLAFKWLWNIPDISLVLSGMSDLEQVKENIKFTDNSNCLTETENNIIEKIRNSFNSKIKVNCNECNYCMPCPSGVSIPMIFTFYNNVYLYNSLDESKFIYENFITKEHNASKCVKCGICEKKCPQYIEIIKKLEDAHKILG